METVEISPRTGRPKRAPRGRAFTTDSSREARLAAAVKDIVDRAPQLTEAQLAKLRQLVAPAETGGAA